MIPQKPSLRNLLHSKGITGCDKATIDLRLGKNFVTAIFSIEFISFKHWDVGYIFHGFSEELT